MDYGIKLDGLPAERVRELAPLVDRSGLDELWVVEDLGLAGGFAQAATVLADTERVRVGLGISPAVARNPAYLAMEIATLARMHPGRFLPGIGHGMPGWLKQVGAHPASLLTALREVAISVGRLLSGDEVSMDGEYVHLDRVALTHPPDNPPPIQLGVRGPKGITLANHVADGVILAEGSGPEYLRTARKAIDPVRRLTVFVWLCVRPDREGARSALRPTIERALAQEFMRFQLGDREPTVSAVDDGLRELTVSGDAASCVEQIESLVSAGADALIFAPMLGDEEGQIQAIRDVLLPVIR